MIRRAAFVALGLLIAASFYARAELVTYGVPLLQSIAGLLPVAKGGTGVTYNLAGAAVFGSGSDGTVAISSGTTTLTRPMAYANLTLSGTGKLNAANYPIFVSGTLDISGAGAQAVFVAPGNPAAPSGATGSNGGGGGLIVGPPGFTSAFPSPGGNGQTGIGSSGGNVSSYLANVQLCGGMGGVGGAGGSATSGGGSAGTLPSAPSQYVLRAPLLAFLPAFTGGNSASYAVTLIGGQGTGGGGGGGDATHSGGGASSGGNGPGVLLIFAATLARGSNATAAIFQAMGAGSGSAGVAGLAPNAGGGGGGGGSGGGCAIGVFGQRTGSTIPNAIDVSGGAGTSGGAGAGTGNAGTGGTGGNCGGAEIMDLAAGSTTLSSNWNGAGTGPTGQTGGAGCQLQQSVWNLPANDNTPELRRAA